MLWVLIGTVSAAALALVVRWKRSKTSEDHPTDVIQSPLDDRERRLAGQLRRMVDCSQARAVEAIRREIRISPNQTDETLVKRALYHYRRDQPDQPCPVFLPRTRG